VHSFQTLLADLATYCRVQATTALNEKFVFTLQVRLTSTQQRTFELLGINPDRTSSSRLAFRQTKASSTPYRFDKGTFRLSRPQAPDASTDQQPEHEHQRRGAERECDLGWPLMLEG
jgi:hypothetical protein